MTLESLAVVTFFGALGPTPGMTRSKTWTRTLECERISVDEANRTYPGQIMEPAPRGDYVERTMLACRQHLMRPGLRDPRDEAILRTLESTAAEMALAARAERPDLHDATWIVQTYYPNPMVSAKLSFATKINLMQQGLRVSDRDPVLGATDVQTITRMHPDEAYPHACARYFETGTVRSEDALLAVMIRDPLETIMHAGVCTQGEWSWLR